MEKENVVSVWLGNTKSNEFLINYIDLKYLENGECIASDFFNDFEIDINDIDEDFIEKVRYDMVSTDLEFLLEGCSYEETVIPNIKKFTNNIQTKFNTVILLYNFEYFRTKSSINNNDYSMKYIGTVSYR